MSLTQVVFVRAEQVCKSSRTRDEGEDHTNPQVERMAGGDLGMGNRLVNRNGTDMIVEMMAIARATQQCRWSWSVRWYQVRLATTLCMLSV